VIYTSSISDITSRKREWRIHSLVLPPVSGQKAKRANKAEDYTMSAATADFEQNIMHMMNALKLLEGSGAGVEAQISKEEDLKNEALKAALWTDASAKGFEKEELLAAPPGLDFGALDQEASPQSPYQAAGRFPLKVSALEALNRAAQAEDSPTESLPESLPKKVSLPTTRQGQLLSVFGGPGTSPKDAAKKLTTNKVPKAATGKNRASGKKFCVYCGSQVDPEYLTAKFCAYCGAEHAPASADSTPTTPDRPPGSLGTSKPRRGASGGSEVKSSYLAAWHAYQMLAVQRFQAQYQQNLAWQGILADAYGELAEGEEGQWSETPPGSFSTMYSSTSMESPESDWPEHGMVW